jgi:hypothetical protein
MKIILLMLSFIIVGCETQTEVLPELSILPQYTAYRGTDMNGAQRVCEESTSNLTCTAEFGPADQFAEDCRAQGYQAVTCGCHDYICLEGSESGFDLDGNRRSCNPMPSETTCTMEFSEEDQYAQDCRESGREAVQCGCHDWICR